jgi:hypothetical protein
MSMNSLRPSTLEALTDVFRHKRGHTQMRSQREWQPPSVASPRRTLVFGWRIERL